MSSYVDAVALPLPFLLLLSLSILPPPPTASTSTGEAEACRGVAVVDRTASDAAASGARRVRLLRVYLVDDVLQVHCLSIVSSSSSSVDDCCTLDGLPISGMGWDEGI